MNIPMGTVGEVSVIQKDNTIEWKMKDFLQFRTKFRVCYSSPEFSLLGRSWVLCIHPNGTSSVGFDDGKPKSTEGYIDVYLERAIDDSPIAIEFSLGLKTIRGKVDPEIYRSYNVKNTGHIVGGSLLKRPELLERQSEYVLSGAITVVCRFKNPEPTGGVSVAAAEKCSYCKMTLEADEDISSHQMKCMDKPIKCPDCADVIALKDWYDHYCQRTTGEASEKLVRDCKSMMLSGNHSDTTIKVKGEEFRLHKSILSSRNSIFDSMFKSDMKEKTTGIVSIDDCEPEVFRSFIHFLYTGKVDKLTPENVCDLYVVADKYQEDLLKKQCLCFMMNAISIDTFCDYIILALRHDEKELFQKTIDFFNSKPKEIVRSVKWQTFLLEYPIQANELFIKTLDHLVK